MARSDLDTPAKPDSPVHHGSFSFKAGPIRARAEVNITSGGLLAIGAMVGGIILAVAPLVWTATSAARKRAERGEKRH